MRTRVVFVGTTVIFVIVLIASAAYADPLTCTLTDYKKSPGLEAVVAQDTLAVTWAGDKDVELRLQFGIERGTPIIRDLAVRRRATQWSTLVANATPEFRVVSGVRRISEQQINPLRTLGIAPTPEIVEKEKWNAFWDAPLYVPGVEEGRAPRNLGLPRKPEEIKRATASYQAQDCEVKTNGARLEITFGGVRLGVFAGRLQYTVYKGANLVRQEVIAKTDEPSVAYKYDAGLKGVAIQESSRVVWRDLGGNWQGYRFGGTTNANAVALKTANRVVVAETKGGSIAAFPPPHTFFWARETEDNLGYSWYRKDDDSSFAFGIRQAEREEKPQYQANFALYSAPPGTWQRMAIYFFVSPEPGRSAIESALAFTRGDRFKPLAGYKVLGHHYHLRVGQRAQQAGSEDLRLPDFDALRAAGINIVSPADTHREPSSWDSGDARLKQQVSYFNGVRTASDSDFLVIPTEEVSCGGDGEAAAGAPRRTPCPPDAYLGAHWDILFSKPVFWIRTRAAGQPLVEEHPVHGKVYHVGNPADVMEMAKRENALVFMPHPRTKGSTGYPDAIKDAAHFHDERYRGVGWRWGMGLDLSEQRLCDGRCLTLLDDMNNWVADDPTPPKYLISLTETGAKAPGDDIYANSPVSYVKLAALPTPRDMSGLINAIRAGDYFVTSGEVLISSYAARGSGAQRTIAADVEWTFPLEFVEVVWGDGRKTERQIIPATDLPPFGRHRFEIPFDATGKKWVRFAVWDSAGNGALVQPIKLTPTTTTTASSR